MKDASVKWATSYAFSLCLWAVVEGWLGLEGGRKGQLWLCCHRAPQTPCYLLAPLAPVLSRDHPETFVVAGPLAAGPIGGVQGPKHGGNGVRRRVLAGKGEARVVPTTECNLR